MPVVVSQQTQIVAAPKILGTRRWRRQFVITQRKILGGVEGEISRHMGCSLGGECQVDTPDAKRNIQTNVGYQIGQTVRVGVGGDRFTDVIVFLWGREVKIDAFRALAAQCQVGSVKLRHFLASFTCSARAAGLGKLLTQQVGEIEVGDAAFRIEGDGPPERAFLIALRHPLLCQEPEVVENCRRPRSADSLEWRVDGLNGASLFKARGGIICRKRFPGFLVRLVLLQDFPVRLVERQPVDAGGLLDVEAKDLHFTVVACVQRQQEVTGYGQGAGMRR